MKQFILILIVFLFNSHAIFSKDTYPRYSTNSGETISDVIIREVLATDTKDGIASEYGITVAELERQNPSIINELTIGFKLKIKKPDYSLENEVPVIDVKADVIGNFETNLFIKNKYEEFVNQLITDASENIGTRYTNGGSSRSGFDCSGLMYATFENFEIILPRSSKEQSEFGTKINIEEAQKGDLIFFHTGRRHRINHVGMIVEVTAEGEIKFIHASLQNGVIISSSKESYYENKIVQVNRVL
jgi:hypothetical protein